MRSPECKYKENERQLKEQLINGINNDSITNKTIIQLTSIKNISEVNSEQVLMFAKTTEMETVIYEI